jgi:hypothetical protein
VHRCRLRKLVLNWACSLYGNQDCVRLAYVHGMQDMDDPHGDRGGAGQVSCTCDIPHNAALVDTHLDLPLGSNFDVLITKNKYNVC